MKKMSIIIVFILSIASHNTFAFGAPLDLSSFQQIVEQHPLAV
jgi:hypothetical protein